MIYSMVTMQCICKRLRKEWILKVLITRRNKWWLKQTWCRGPFQRALASSRYVVHLECMFGDRCISAETCFGVRRAAERPCTFFGLFTASLCLGSLWRKSEDPRAVTLFDLTFTQAPAASPLSCGARGPYAVCRVCVCCSGHVWRFLCYTFQQPQSVDTSWTCLHVIKRNCLVNLGLVYLLRVT